MLRVEYAHWGQSPEDLRHLALSAPHARTRERALALYEIAQGSCATRVAGRTGRHPQTVMGWVHAYNAQGPDALGFRRTGGRPPFALRLRRRFETPSAPPSVRPPPHPERGPTRIGVKIALDPARVGTILGRCKTQHLPGRIILRSCCGASPPLSILTASPDKPRRSSAGVRSTVALTCCAWRWPAALVACR